MSSRRGSRETYHHGSLREALIKAAEVLIDERGLEGFSLRETARRAGVSPAAPAHHFRDAKGLLSAVAASAFWRFGKAMEAADKGEEFEQRLRTQAVAYLRFAKSEGAKFKLMWRIDLTDRTDPELAASIRAATDLFLRATPGAADETGDPPDLAVAGHLDRFYDPSLAPSLTYWVLVHGFSILALDRVFGRDNFSEERSHERLLLALLDRLRI